MADRNLVLQLLITANDAASPEIQRLTGALNELGIETQVIADGMAESERKALAAFGAIADSARSTGDMIERSLVAALGRIESPQGVIDLQNELQRLRQSGRLSAEELAKLADAQEQLDRLAYAAGQSEAALSQELQRQRIAAQQAADAADGLGDASGRSTRAFVDHREASGALGEALSNVADQFGISGEAFDALTGQLAKGAALALLAKQFFDANNAADQLAKQFRAMTGDTQTAAQEIEFLNGVANRWGVSVNELAPAYLRLAAATKGSTAEGEQTRQMIDDLTAAYMNAGAGVEDVQEVMEILGETFAEGRVSIDAIKEGMQEDMPPAIQAATTAILENDAALKKMLESGDAATEDFMPAFATALRKHIGGSTTHIESMSASFTRLVAGLNELMTKIDDIVPIMAVFDGAVQGVIKTAETAISGVSLLADGFAFVGRAIGAAAGALATGEDALAAMAAEAETTGASMEKTALHLIGLKTATEEAAERQAQMTKELQALREETDPYGAALDALAKKLQAAADEFTKTGDAVKLTQAALEDFLTAPEKNLNVEGVLKLAAALKTVGTQAEDSGRQISDTLGQELANLSSHQLAELERQARSAMAAASDGSETSRLAFAELGQVVESVVLARLQRLGVDGPEALRGVSTAATDAIADFQALAEAGVLSADGIQAAFAGALQQLDNPEELAQFRQQIIELGDAGVLSGEQVDQALRQIQQRLQEVANDPAFAALQTALAAIREETERGIAVGDRERESLNARIQAAINLAKARGDEAEAARLSAVATQDEVDAAELRIKQLARQKTEIADHIQQIYAQAQADGVYTDAERQVVEALQEKSVALGHEIALIEAKLPLQQQEAAAAERAAGPIGQLIRLYEQKTAAAERETNAIERGYADKQRDLDVEIAQAEAKGDSLKASELKIDKAELEAEAARALADALAAQMAVEIEALEAKKLDIQASDLSVKAKAEEIAQINELIAKKREQADAAQDAADVAKASADQEIESAKKSAQAVKDAAEAAESAERETRRLGGATLYAAKNFDQLTEAGRKAWEQLQRMELMGKGPGEVARLIKAFDDLLSAEIKANAEIDALIDTTYGIGPAADHARQQLLNMARTGNDGIRGLTSAGEAARQKLQQIRDAALEAEQALAAMADDFRREMLQIQGDQRTLLQLEQQDRLAQLEAYYRESGELGAEEYRTAKARAEELHRLKLQQLDAEQQADTTDVATQRVSRLADEGERAGRAMNALGGASLAQLNDQADALRQHLQSVNSLL